LEASEFSASIPVLLEAFSQQGLKKLYYDFVFQNRAIFHRYFAFSANVPVTQG
jgi:hypothetical protein